LPILRVACSHRHLRHRTSRRLKDRNWKQFRYTALLKDRNLNQDK